MAAFSGQMSSVASLALSRSGTVDYNKFSFASSMSSISLRGKGENADLRKRGCTKVRAGAKKLHFNKDGAAIRKLQVSFC